MTALYVMYFNKGQNTIYINTVLNNNNVLLLIDYVNVLLVQAILAICFSNVFYLISWNKCKLQYLGEIFQNLNNRFRCYNFFQESNCVFLLKNLLFL